MNTRMFFSKIICSAAILSAVSCAKPQELDSDRLEKISFEAWTDKYLDKSKVALQDNGMYIEFLNDPTDTSLPSCADEASWARVNYTFSTLYNDVFLTRSEQEALKQGTYTTKTYYTPAYIFCGDDNVGMASGQYYALKSKELKKPDGTTTRMRVGSRVRLYMPSKIAFGSAGYSDDQGYGCQNSLDGKMPVIEELELMEVVLDPVKREEEMVKRVAEEEWGLTVNDTIAENIYLDSRFRSELSEPFDPSQLLTKDSTVNLWIIGKFLSRPGEQEFILDTNIDSVYTRFHSRQPGYEPAAKSHSSILYNPKNHMESTISAFYQAVPKMRRGKWYRIIFTSAYGYGASGLSAEVKKQQEYNNYYMQYMLNEYYSSSSSYNYNNYYNSYYDSYYSDSSYLDYSTSSYGSSSTEIITEIQPFTPLIFEIYIEPKKEE